MLDRLDLNAIFYQHVHKENHHPKWRGIKILKMPSDLILYAEAIYDKKPDVIVEIGTKFGGSALFFQDMIDGKVVTIDIKSQIEKRDDRIEYIIGSSLDDAVLKRVRKICADKKTMLVIDGNHSKTHVWNELLTYRDIVTKGQYLVLEDCYVGRKLYGPGKARNEFLKESPEFKKTEHCSKYLVGVTLGGWLMSE